MIHSAEPADDLAHFALAYPGEQCKHPLPAINHLTLSSAEIARMMGFPRKDLAPAHAARLQRWAVFCDEQYLIPLERPDAP
ncbi:hypothetical protein [Chromobacterium phragmitis]|uniref:Uncharacterized protein n=1 Tax=Chromobacterium phragmitis TaxID=2202141 RepID=A0A344UPF3_9NEIS|nr:hypothetical protein [Chromobacterium phragmitis]AXE37151.1 hypothetical protein DK843_22635 [Chromobacterium phragmitis]